MNSGIGPLAALATLAAIGGFGLVALVARRRGRLHGELRFAVLGGIGALLGGYGVLLVVMSLSSASTILAPGEAVRFCGFYLDCHTSAAVDSVRLVRVEEGDRWRYIVRVLFASDARRATLRVPEPRAVLIAEGGVRLEPVSGPGDLRLAGGTEVGADFVFEAASPVVRPRLIVSRGGALERLTELFLAGDENSLLHARTHLLLPDPI